MSGNVSELCQDWYGHYNSFGNTNPTGPTSGSRRVSRGGYSIGPAKYCRVSKRGDTAPSYSSKTTGLRLAL